MAVSYKKLWKLLIDKDMKKKELEQQAKVSHYTVSKMYRGENVTIDILERICKTLDCSLDDMLYANFENNFEKAVFWYLRFYSNPTNYCT
ncbi:helix-turn-helix domain-containing protein [Butyricicoccus porcorum]|uniref:helix-turn-helix domain-containing protein n=1 Tax=Butyricicoccus porcorum TaxID=1945634 RepID=UPI003F4AEDE7